MSNSRLLVKLAWAMSAFLVSASGTVHGQSVDSLCANTTWSNCGVAVKEALQKNPSDPKDILQIASAWGRAYDARYNELRAKGRVEKATPDADKIFEAVSSKLNPLEIAKDKARDALVKKYLARLAPVVEWAGGSVAEGLKAFLDSSEIATDYDELRLINDDIQSRVATLLQPFVKPDWKETLNQAVREAGPQLRKP